MSNSLSPHGLWHARLLGPWDSYRQELWVIYHFLLQLKRKTKNFIITENIIDMEDDCKIQSSN